MPNYAHVRFTCFHHLDEQGRKLDTKYGYLAWSDQDARYGRVWDSWQQMQAKLPADDPMQVAHYILQNQYDDFAEDFLQCLVDHGGFYLNGRWRPLDTWKLEASLDDEMVAQASPGRRTL